MAANKTRNKQQSAALRSEIYRRYCSGQTQASIAAALGVHQSNVAYHVAKAREANQIEIAARRHDRLNELDSLRSQCWEAWEQDQTPQAVAFLAQIQKCIAQERAMLGLDAPRSVTASIAISELPNDTQDVTVGAPEPPQAS